MEDDDKRPSRSKVVGGLLYLLATVLGAVILTGIQGNRAAINDLRDDFGREIGKLEEGILSLERALEAEIDRLDESNRSSRDSIASLEVATASNQTAIEELRRDLERVLPP